jgi:phage FluMu protein Com
MAATGEIGPDDLVRPEGQEEWYSAKSMKGLFDKAEQSVLQAQCPGCDAPLTYDSKFFGKKFKCAKCLRVVEINKEGIPQLVSHNAAIVQALTPYPADSRSIEYKCKHCKAVLETDSSLGMKEEICPLCNKVNQVPPSKEQQSEQIANAIDLMVQEQREEAERLAEGERLQRQQEIEKQHQYHIAIQQAKATPGTPKVWYCYQNGQERGPMQEAMIQRWIDDGQLGPDDWVRTEEGNAWIRVGDIPERFLVSVQKTNNSVPFQKTYDSVPVRKTNNSAPRNVARCPKCGSTNIQVVSQMKTKGFGCGKGCCGAILLGPFGWLCGLCGMGEGKSKITRVCAACGKQF